MEPSASTPIGLPRLELPGDLHRWEEIHSAHSVVYISGDLVWKEFSSEVCAVAEANVYALLHNDPTQAKFFPRARGFNRTGDSLYICMERIGDRTLQDIIDGDIPRSETNVSAILGGITTSLDALHAYYGCIHRDLKPANVFVTESNHMRLADFSLSRSIGPGHGPASGSHEYISEVITMWYRPPELMSAGSAAYGSEVDIWSLGAIMVQFLFPRLFNRIFCHSNETTMLASLNVNIPGLGRTDEFLSMAPGLRSIVVGMLSMDPSERPSAAEISKRYNYIVVKEPMPMPPRVISAPGMDLDGRNDVVRDIVRAATAATRKVIAVDMLDACAHRRGSYSGISAKSVLCLHDMSLDVVVDGPTAACDIAAELDMQMVMFFRGSICNSVDVAAEWKKVSAILLLPDYPYMTREQLVASMSMV